METISPNKQRNPFRKDARIVVIGAGPSGIHMAHMLKTMGYSNVRVLEKSNRIGGKSKSIKIDGIPHEMGTCFLTTQYEEVNSLAEN